MPHEMTNSFEALRGSEPLWLEITVDQVTFTESMIPDHFEYGISPLLICAGTVSSSSGREGDVSAPFQNSRLEVRAREEAKIVSLEGKFPLGWVEVRDDSTSIVLFARPTLVSAIAQHLSLVQTGGIRFSLTLPFADSYPAELYPVLAYGYRAHASKSDA